MIDENRVKGFIEATQAQVVRERQHGGDVEHGPAIFERVGVRFGSRVFWIGAAFYPGDNGDQFRLDEALCIEIVRRWHDSP
jgi:hypothetical protein